MRVVSAGQKPLLVVSGQYRSVQLLHFAAALPYRRFLSGFRRLCGRSVWQLAFRVDDVEFDAPFMSRH
jgi:hypothetical protein